MPGRRTSYLKSNENVNNMSKELHASMDDHAVPSPEKKLRKEEFLKGVPQGKS
jgi:hypothetical protein